MKNLVTCLIVLASFLIVAPASSNEQPTQSAKPQAQKLLLQARQKEKAGDYSGLMRDITEVIKLDPTIAIAYCMRATCKEVNGDYRGSLADCSHAIALEPNGYPGFYVRRAIPEYKLKMFNECIRDCSTTLKRDPNNSMAYKYRAQAKVQLDQHEHAVSDINSYLKLAPNDEAAKEFKNQLMADLEPSARDDEWVKRGYEDGGRTPSVHVEHKLQPFIHENHSVQLLPPLNFTLQTSSLPMDNCKSFMFTGPAHPTGGHSVFQVAILLPTANQPLPSEQVISDAILRPFKQRMTSYTEKEAQFQLATKSYKGLFFEGKHLWFFGEKGFIFVTRANGALFFFFGADSDQHFDKSMRLFSETLKTCTIK